MRNFLLYTFLLLLGLALGSVLMGAAHVELDLTLPHHKFVKYGAMLTVLVLIVGWAIRDGMARSALGLQTGEAATHILAGFGTTLILLLPLWLFLVWVGARDPDWWLWSNELIYRAGIYLLIGFAVATLEELYFRGLLLSDTGKFFLIPLVGSTVLYALVHFIRPIGDGASADHWLGGGIMLLDAVMRLPHTVLMELPQLGLLLMIGLGLGLLRLRTGSLALCIGAHAAMVFSLKMLQKFTDSGDAILPLIDNNSRGGWAGAIWLAILVLAVLHQTRKQT